MADITIEMEATFKVLRKLTVDTELCTYQNYLSREGS